MKTALLALALAACAGAPPPDPLAEFDPASTIRGRIVDADGAPIEGATAQLGVFAPSHVLPSDADGRFASAVGDGYEPGAAIELITWAPGYVARFDRMTLGARDVEIVLERGATIAGRIRTSDGATVPDGTEIVLRTSAGQQRTVVTAGAFEVAGFDDAEDGWLVARVDGWVPRRVEGLTLTSGETLDLGVLIIERGATLEVTAVDGFGERVLGGSAYVRTEATPVFEWSGRADDDGVMRLAGLPIGAPLRVQVGSPDGFGRGMTLEHDVRTITLDAVENQHRGRLLRPVLLRGALEWGGAGPAPWSEERQVMFRATAFAEGAPVWEHTAAVQDLGTPIAERESVDFILWARPGRWTIELEQRVGSDETRWPRATLDVDVPSAPYGERSGEHSVGTVVFRR